MTSRLVWDAIRDAERERIAAAIEAFRERTWEPEALAALDEAVEIARKGGDTA